MKPAFLLIFVIVNSIYGQHGDYCLGARSSAMGSASVALSDNFSSFNNIGGLASIDKSSIVFSIKNLYAVDGLYVLGAAYNQKYNQGAFVFSLYRFGDQLWNEHKIGIGYSHRISFVSVGLQVNYLQYAVKSYGTTGAMVLEFGGMAKIIPEISVGASIFNPNLAKIGNTQTEPLPIVLKAAIAYHPNERTILICETQKEIIFPAKVKVGLEYILKDKFPLRTGIIFRPASISAGFGIYLSKFKLDYSTSMDPRLGMTNHFSIVYLLPKK